MFVTVAESPANAAETRQTYDAGASRPQPPLLSISSGALLKGQREILIRHGDATYRLRHTSNDKLILTK